MTVRCQKWAQTPSRSQNQISYPHGFLRVCVVPCGKLPWRPERPCRIVWLPPPLTPPPRAGKSSPPDGLGGGLRKAATHPKPLSVFASRSLSRVRFAGLRPPWTGPSTRSFCPGFCSCLSLRRGARSRHWRNLAQQTTENPSQPPPPTSRLPTEAALSGGRA